jgi:ribosome maturation factor RimP
VGSRPLFLCAAASFLNNLRKRAEVLGQGSIEERVQEIAGRVALDHGLELVHAEIAGPENKPIVRIFIDKPQGVTHEDCSAVSLHVGTILDVEDFIHAAYTLEVSSPGLERGLYKLADYERFSGSSAKMKVRQPINGQRNFRGRIAGVEGEQVIFEDKTSGRITVPLKSIVKANLEIDVEEEFRRAKQFDAIENAAKGSNRQHN